jgi:hypothetical protein
MHDEMPRRQFLGAVPAVAYALTAAVKTREAPAQAPAPPSGSAGAVRLEAFDYKGVTLGPSRWKRQCDAARTFYLGLSNDDIVQGFRAAAGLAAPGRPLGGWCGKNSSTVFGQWLSGMARMYRATGDEALRDKGFLLFSEWAKTVKPTGDCGMNHYPFDKLVCGLVDLQRYAGYREAAAMLERVTAYAARNLERPAAPLADITDNQAYYGRPQEWYTLGENLFRAYQLTGDSMFRSFAETWLYHGYWDKFLTSAAPEDAHGVHAYSHVNTFSSAAMAYEVTGNPRYLAIIEHAYAYLQRFQCYATGGYGPNERFMKTDGSLGRALDTRSDTFEAVCGSWAGFKLAKYLMRYTGEARYGDWIERLFYNGVGAALPVTGEVRNFYYADYRVGGGMKVYNWDTCTCCSGTYLQNMADYHDLIYFKDGDALHVNLYVPSQVVWRGPGSDIHLTQDTEYPDADTTTLTIRTERPAVFALRFRVPTWTTKVAVTVNGTPAWVNATPGTWGTIRRTWQSGDRIELQFPLTLRMEPVDPQHPDRVAVVRGPVVLVLEGAYHDPNFRLPMRDDELSRWLVPETGRTLASGIWSVGQLPAADPLTIFRVALPDKSPVRLRFRPFYETAEGYPYFMYFDRTALPWRLW